MDILLYVIISIVSYLIGCISFAYIIGKIVLRRDIRKYGSGNAGTANMMRNFGVKLGLLTFLGDALKGTLACFIGYMIAGQIGSYFGAVFAIIGHMYPVFMKFKGGKGVATAGGILFYLAPAFTGVIFTIAIIIMAATKMISLGSLIGITLICLGSFVVYPSNMGFQITTFIIMAMLYFAHRENIKRLFAGTETKMDLTKIRPKKIKETKEQE